MKTSVTYSLFVFSLLLSFPLTTLAQEHELIVQTGHNYYALSVAISPGGRTLASGSLDNTVKLWELKSGLELRTFTGHEGSVQSVAFSPDGRTLASGSEDKSIKLWDIASGRELRTFKGHTGSTVAFSPDGRTLASESGNAIKLWDVSSGQELQTFAGASAPFAISSDGKMLASGNLDDGTVKLWNIATAEQLRTLTGHTLPVKSVAFSSDGRVLATGSFDSTIRLWDAATGREMRTLTGHASFISSLAFSPDGRILASASEVVKLWDVKNGSELRSFTGHSSGFSSIAFTPDGKRLVGSSNTNAINLWDVTSGREVLTLKGHAEKIFSVAFSPDGRTLASGGGKNRINLWDLANGQQLRTLKGHTDLVSTVVFSPDGRTLASGSDDKSVKLWDMESGKELRTLTGHSRFVHALAFAPDGRTLASGSFEGTVKLWDMSRGQELRTLNGHTWFISSMAFSPDGRTLATGSGDETIKLWDTASGKELSTLTGNTSYVASVAFSPDGRTLASVNGRTLSTQDLEIRLWDVESGQARETLEDTPENRSRLGLNGQADSARLAAGRSENGKIKLTDRKTGTELCDLVALDENDWLVVTPGGFFDGSPAAWKQAIWRLGNNTFNYAPVEAFFSDFFHPGLLQEIFNGRAPKAVTNVAQKDIRQPRVKVALANDSLEAERISEREVAISIEIVDAPPDARRPNTTSGARDVRLFRNNSLVKLWPGNAFSRTSGCKPVPTKAGESRRTLCETRTRLIAGENQLTAYAFNNDNVKSIDDTLVLTGLNSLKRKGLVYILAIGVDVYANTEYKLNYAVADAQDFAEELKRQQSKLNNYERVDVISLKDKDATKANILKALNDLSLKVQPEDALVIFFAGHGTAQQNRFYLIPHDLGYEGSRTQLDGAALQSIISHSISDEELEKAVEGIDAGQMLLVIDACNSGQALEAEEKRRGPMNSKGLAQLAYEKGMYILTAAQSYQAALEASKLGHGYLTYALVEEGLKTPAADLEPKDNQVLLREWLDYTTNRVPQMQQEYVVGKRQLVQQGAQPTEAQRPRVFYRREVELQPLIVARP